MLAVWYPTYMQSFIISHSSCAEQYGDMSADTQMWTHRHTIKPPTAGVELVGHTSIMTQYTRSDDTMAYTRTNDDTAHKGI